ncbi:MAG TPA: hydroxyisourate hydrolase [Propionibacteriaceae bacterium]|nr:hydroxyisourate hydrolase [Propionibacteriaceae bacterium]
MSEHRSRVTTHVLDATSGRPAAGVEASLERQGGNSWQPVTRGRTDSDGRINDFGPEALEPGVYRVTFAVGPYFAERGQPTFYPEVVIPFRIDDPEAHYHVPLLLSPFAYSTYRGS